MTALDSGRYSGSMPTPLTSFIGRARELADLSALLRDRDVRLVTVIGPGGVGKTRLATEASAGVASDFVDGVVFVDLAPVRDPTLVIPAIASAMGARSGAPTVASLVSALGAASHCLIFLDNFEQVVDAAPVIADLLRHAPTLKILVTSREPLKIGGEWEFQITPLSVVNSALSIEELEQHDAIRLFASRSRAVDRNFALTEDNLKAVSEICRLVDGLPLGIELAAARIKSLPPAALLARLERRLPMLAGERRDMPERQQTMRDAIGWSYQILSPSEQNLFRWLGVFAGGFTLEAIESITNSMAGDGIDTLADLSSLLDKCLVQASSGRSADLRYQMLETIREFAAEQLAASDDYRAVRDAHAAWFTRVAADRRHQGIGWAERRLASNTPSIFEVEYSNIRAALVWFDETDNLGGLARLAGAIYWYWVFHGPRMEGLRWLRRASHLQPETITDKTSRMWALEGLGLMARNAGEFDEASNAVEECLTLAQELGDETAGALALAFLSFIGLARGEYDESDALTVAAIDRFTHLVPDWPIGGVIAHRGLAAFGKRDLDRAAQHFGEAIDASRSIGDRFNVAINLGYLSVVRSEQGRYPEAASLLAEALPFLEDLSSQESISEFLADVAVLAQAIGQHEAGARNLGAAEALRDSIGHAFTLPELDAYERAKQSLRDALGDDAFTRAWRSGSIMPDQQAITDASAFLEQVTESHGTSAPDRREPAYGLTARELDVLRVLVEGRSDREIADLLFIGQRTVETHVSNLLAKLGVRNRAEATAFAVREGLI